MSRSDQSPSVPPAAHETPHRVVVGTDTAVGKTVVTAGLVGAARDRGVDAVGVKPCQTGYPEDDDAAVVRAVCEDSSAATCLRTREPALAPAVAARRTDEPLAYEAIREDVRDWVDHSEAAVVEGIGGLDVPLTAERTVLDLVADLALPTVVVARSGLGTLNHTGLTVRVLRDSGVPVVGAVLNRYEGDSVAERTNPDVLERRHDLRVATLPPLVDIERVPAVVGEQLPVPFLPGMS